MTTSYCGGIGGVDDNAAQAGYVVAQTVTGGVTHTLTSEGSDASEDGTGRGTPIVVHPLAVRGREGGAQLEVGPEGGPYNTLRAGDGGSSRQSLVAIGFHATQDHPISSTERVPAIGAKSIGNGVHTETVVRRLTPTECERLQGYPDGWTDGQADSARYRQLGNSIAVPVFEWVAHRLVAVDSEVTA